MTTALFILESAPCSIEYSRGMTRLDKATRILRLVARLDWRFGVLLFEKVSRVEYNRAAVDSLDHGSDSRRGFVNGLD